MTLITSRSGGGCPVCGAAHASCGGPTTVTVIDERTEIAVTEGPLRLYDVVVNGNKTQMRLNEQDAESYGDNATLALGQGSGDVGEKRREVPNKARTAEGKGN